MVVIITIKIMVSVYQKSYVADGAPYGRLWEGLSPRPPSRLTHQTRITAEHFIFHKVLGKGSFGKVTYKLSFPLTFIYSVEDMKEVMRFAYVM